eukprot:TRINITY_DN12090_c0_g1_i1.p1 TRINITY_DN12090_c0_g1~~TRINITY_DN12090_c0_g1_i1.p1  ORF type:complete len:456 (+),score=72.87 TRINITY_DN12090_c0_g1_i1:67-1368(+)
MLPSKISSLGNGFRVASQWSPSETVTVGVWVDTGSRDEIPASSGVAHFWEHMTFKGTGRRTRADIEQTVEGIGGHFNAYTTRENTAFYIRCFKKDAPIAVDLLSDVLLNSTVSDYMVEQERHTIREEMIDVDSRIEEVIMEYVHNRAFSTDSLGMPILGPENNIMHGITRKMIKSFVDTNYVGQRMVLVGTGDIDHDNLIKLADRDFGKVARGNPAPVHNSNYVGGLVKTPKDALPLLHAVVAFKHPGYESPYEVPLMLLQHFWGSWSREKGETPLTPVARLLCQRPEVSDFQSFFAPYRQVGLIGMYLKLYPNGATPAAEICGAMLQELVRPAVTLTEEELERAKQALKAATLMNLTNTATYADDLGKQILFYGRSKPMLEFFAEIDAVTVEKMQEAVRACVANQLPTVCTIGDVETLPEANWWIDKTRLVA